MYFINEMETESKIENETEKKLDYMKKWIK